MLSFNNKISIRQLQLLLILDIFGTGVTTLPRVVTEQAGQDGWVCVVLAAVAVMLLVPVLCYAANKYPNKNFVELAGSLLTKPIGVLIAAVFLIKIIITCSIELRIFGEIIKATILTVTPFPIICAVMLLICAYAAAKGYETRARIGEILIIVIALPLIVVFGIASGDVDFSNILPAFETPPANIAKGAFAAIFAFNGLELVMLIFPYLQRPEKAVAGIMQSVALIGAFMLVLTLITISRFGIYDITRQMWPVLEMMDTIDIPGSFIERQDALMMSFWIVSVFAVVNACLFFSSVIFKDIINKGKRPYFILFIMPVIYIVSFLPHNIAEAYEWKYFLNKTFGIAFLTAVPVLLSVSAMLKRRAEKGGAGA